MSAASDKAKERTLSKYGEAMRSSLGFNRTPGTPAGMAPPSGSVAARMAGVVNDREAAVIEVSRIAPDPDQPRRAFDDEAIDRLAESLRTRGQLQNVVVYWSDDLGSYVLVSGERRWRAARKAGLPTLRCKLLDRPPDEADRLALQLVENCVREDLKPVEQAAAFRALMESNGWSTRQLADALHMAQAKVVYALGLLDLPEELRRRVDRGELAPRTAYEIGRLERPDDQVALADRVSSEGLTRDDVIAEVRAAQAPAEPVSSAKPASASRSKGRGGASSSSKGRGGGRLPTSKSFRFPGGKLTIERPKGLDASSYRAAARLLLEQADRLDPPASDGSPPDPGADPSLAA
ncbi:ParB/RepB/Spo0J family partition protein [Tautonia sociabilis]|uniref:ParB/RepB/Spo0J family partition protein n=1 Tax=Tautonia sociabilis TaxID=2080755 RepID=A0A432MEU0_9BACT|nr:ParB/RepB/Spo0J family partition protein [Tautonia sociabilis]RUL84197.1 ParB/RepB/Spo0J family partition protein [Tautonia sociabilis]